jgi:hypothetical protein
MYAVSARLRWLSLSASAVVLCVVTSPASGQAPGRPLPGYERPIPGVERRTFFGEETTTGPTGTTSVRAPLTLVPSVTVSEEFNDNIFLDNNHKVWDFITSITPALTLTADSPRYHLGLSYDFSARIYARDSSQDGAFDRQSLFLDSVYRVSPTVTVSLADTFTFDIGLNALAPSGIATGRNRSLTNTIEPGASWQIDPLTTLRGRASWTTLHYQGGGLHDSDTWRIGPGVERAFSPRLKGTFSYEFAFFDIQAAPNTTTHTPRIGASYDITRTLVAVVNGGPSIVETDGQDTRIAPAVTASLRQRFERWSAGITFDRAVDVSGALGVVSDVTMIRGDFLVFGLMRGLTVDFRPEFKMYESPGDNQVDVKSFSLPLQATYQIKPWLGVSAGYVFFHQRSNSRPGTTVGTTLGNDVDQNRVFVGVQFGYPIKFD